MSQDMLSFGDAQATVAAGNLNRGIANVNRLYGTNVGQGGCRQAAAVRRVPHTRYLALTASFIGAMASGI